MERITKSPEETYGFAYELAKNACPGDIICLDGELGVGKTVFTQGFAAGLGIREPVNSPTFTILRIYDEGRIPLYHFDVYRIGSPDEMDELGYEEYFFGDGVCIIEWASIIEDIIPDNAKHVVIEKDMEKDFDYRKITCS